jgi:hypothetical protein
MFVGNEKVRGIYFTLLRNVSKKNGRTTLLIIGKIHLGENCSYCTSHSVILSPTNMINFQVEEL